MCQHFQFRPNDPLPLCALSAITENVCYTHIFAAVAGFFHESKGIASLIYIPIQLISVQSTFYCITGANALHLSVVYAYLCYLLEI